MEQRDYLIKQINQLGRLLAKIMADLIGNKNSGRVNEGIEQANKALIAEVNLNIEKLLAKPTSDFFDSLLHDLKFNDENLYQLADILLVMADSQSEELEKEKTRKLYAICLALYQHLETAELTYSFDRHLKIERIKKLFV